MSGTSDLLHLDTFSGIAGNMFLGALLDAGLPRRVLVEDLSVLPLAFKLRVTRVTRGALAARYVDVVVPKPKASAKAKRGGRASRKKPAKRKASDGLAVHDGAPHAHDHHHDANAPHHHGHAHHHHTTGRHYDEIRKLLDAASLDPSVRDRAQEIFAALAKAEARVHGVPVEKVHFHEVGAVDAIVDVTGAAIGLHRLGVSRVTATPVALGHGSVETQHGLLPLPAPATLELLKGVPTVPAHIAFETVTPTGAAILRTITDAYGPLPEMTPSAVGHGAGNERPGPMPNVLRAVLGHGATRTSDRVAVLESNLDDFVPEHLDHLMERLFEAGALDVSLQHVQAKKNRPGFLLRAIVRPSEQGALAGVLFAETPTLGVRVSQVDRLVLPRRSIRVETPFGRISVKVASGDGGRVDVSAEYDDCKRAAKKTGAPLRDVVRKAEDAARSKLEKGA